MSHDEKVYIAGFLDGDGSIHVQIVKGKAYRYGFTIRTTVCFYQKKNRHWFILWLQKTIKQGRVRIRKDGISEYTLTGFKPVKHFLEEIGPFLRIKKPLARMTCAIIERYQNIHTEADFREVCELVDKTAEYTDSKKRIYTASVVKEFLDHL